MRYFRLLEKDGVFHIQYRNEYFGFFRGPWKRIHTFSATSPENRAAAITFYETQVEFYSKTHIKDKGQVIRSSEPTVYVY